MPRLGELLVAAGVITPAQLEEGLRAQVIHGARLGTNLVELRHVELDQVAVALARQHGLPPAMQRHFERCDPEVQGLLAPRLAGLHLVVPIGFLTGEQEQVMIASRGPLTAPQLRELEVAMGFGAGAAVLAICPELRILYFLERVYAIPRANRFLRVRRSTRDSAHPDIAALEPPPTRHAPPGGDETPAEEAWRSETSGYRTFDDTTGRFAPAPAGSDEVELEDLELDGDGTEDRTTGFRGPSPLDAEQLVDLEFDPFEPPDDFHIEETPVAHIIDPPAPGTSWRRPHAAAEIAGLSLDDQVAEVVPKPPAHPIELGGEELRRFVETLADAPPPSSPALARIAIRRVAVKPSSGEMADAADVAAIFADNASLDEVARAIRRAGTRNRVGDLAIGAVRRFGGDRLGAGIMFVVREAVAIGWKGFVTGNHDLCIDELAVPLDSPNVLAVAAREGRALLIDGPQATDLDRRLWRAIGVDPPGQVAVAPVQLAGHPVCLFYGHADQMAPLAELFAAVTQATTTAFARLLRAAQR